MTKKPTKPTDSTASASTPPARAPAVRPESKKARLIGMLRQPDGSTISAITAALGWQAHTTRAAITGLRKAGHAVETAKPADGGAGLTYRIGAKPQAEPDRAISTEASQ